MNTKAALATKTMTKYKAVKHEGEGRRQWKIVRESERFDKDWAHHRLAPTKEEAEYVAKKLTEATS